MLRAIVFSTLVYPLAALWFCLGVRGRRHLPTDGPALIVANHNSHLDTVVLLCAFDWRTRIRVFSAAAADTFFRHPVIAFATRLLFGAIPVERGGDTPLDERLAPVVNRLKRGGIVILYPEGTRGDPDVACRFRKGGLAHLCAAVPELVVVPAYIDGAARAMPKGAIVPVPFCIDVHFGVPIVSPLPEHAWAVAQEAVARLDRRGAPAASADGPVAVSASTNPNNGVQVATP